MTARLRPRLGALLGATLLVGLSAAPALAAGLALPGEPLEASGSSGDPTAVEAGIHQVVLGPETSDHRFLTYHRTLPNSTVHVSALASSYTDAYDNVSIDVTTSSGETCPSDSESGYGLAALAFTASVRIGQEVDEIEQPDSEQPACVAADDLVIELGRGSGGAKQDLPVAVRIIEEASVSSVDDLPTGLAENQPFRSPSTDGTQELASTGTLAEPVDLDDLGQAVTGRIRTGRAAVYRVQVGWGQRIDAQVFTDSVEGVSFAGLGVAVLDPRLAADRTTAETGTVTASERGTATAAAGPVRYLNRYAADGPYLPGDYLVVVGVAGQTSPQDVPYTLKVQVSGKESGAPAYRGGADGLVVSGTTATDTVGAAGGGWTLVRGGAVAALALVGVAGIGGGVTLLRRR